MSGSRFDMMLIIGSHYAGGHARTWADYWLSGTRRSARRRSLQRILHPRRHSTYVHQFVHTHLDLWEIVSGQAWTSHRDASLFPEPLVVSPERWIERTGGGWVDKSVPAEVYAAWFPFGR